MKNNFSYFICVFFLFLAQISFSQKVIIEDELEVLKGTTTKSLIIDSNNNPYLEFRVDSQSVYEILYNDYANELVILNENNEQTLTIQGDKVYVNGLYGNYTRQVMVDTSGLLHVPPFSKTVTFAEVLKEESSPDYKTHYYGYNLPEGQTDTHNQNNLFEEFSTTDLILLFQTRFIIRFMFTIY